MARVAVAADEDLRGKDLSRADLRRCDLTGRDLTGADLSLADLRGANLERARLGQARFTGARLRGCLMQGADLSGADLSDVDLTAADLRQANLTGANLARTLVQGACFDEANLAQATLPALCFRQASLRLATLEHADLSGAQLVDGTLVGADLSGASLKHADLSFADLEGAILRGAALDGADLSGANLAHVDLRDATVMGARLCWVLGLPPSQRQDLRQRGARVPVAWIADPWARFNAVARRHAGLLYVTSLVVVTALAIGIAMWVGHQMAGSRLYPLTGEKPGIEVDCGAPGDSAFSGDAGFVGGSAASTRHLADAIRGATQAPAQTYLTARHGEDFGYRFRLSPGWYTVQLHFAELFHARRGERTFDISIEGQVVSRSFDILAEAEPATAVVRSWAVLVDDGYLDLHFKRRQGRAKINLIRVNRLDGQ